MRTLLLFCALIFGADTQLSAQSFVFNVEDADINVGDTASLVFSISADVATETSGVSMFMRQAPGSSIEVTGVTGTTELLATNGGAGPDFFESQILNDQTTGQWGTFVGIVYDFILVDNVIIDTTVFPVFTYDLLVPAGTAAGVEQMEFDDTAPYPSPTDSLVTVVSGPDVVLNTFGPGGTGTITVIADITFSRGDVISNGIYTIGDCIKILAWIAGIIPTVDCVAATDIEGDGDTDLSDVLFMLSWIFAGGPGFSAGICTDVTSTANCASSACP